MVEIRAWEFYLFLPADCCYCYPSSASPADYRGRECQGTGLEAAATQKRIYDSPRKLDGRERSGTSL